MVLAFVFVSLSYSSLGTIGFPVDEVEFLDLVSPQAGDLCLRNRPEVVLEVDGITGVKVFGWGTTDPFHPAPVDKH